jgi:hypothetical protein
MSTSLNPLEATRAKLAHLDRLRAAIAALTLDEFLALFRHDVLLPDGVLASLQSAIDATSAKLQALDECPDAVNAAWQRDIDAWRAQGGNCD